MKKQMTKIAVMLMLVICFMTSAVWAQSQEDEISFSTQPFTYTGVETAKGTFEATSEMVYGNNFILHSYDVIDSSYKGAIYHFTVSLDYSNSLAYSYDQSDALNSFPVTGGSWSLVVYIDNTHVGTLFGKVAGGSI